MWSVNVCSFYKTLVYKKKSYVTMKLLIKINEKLNIQVNKLLENVQ
jgi:hypothetical protein